MEAYHILELIGEGSFGKVYKGRLKSSKKASQDRYLAEPAWFQPLPPYHCQVVALKVMETGGKSAGELEALSREIQIMSSLSHPYIIQLYAWHQTDTQVRELDLSP